MIDEKLCQIEQSMGVCHVAEFRPWGSQQRAELPNGTIAGAQWHRNVPNQRRPLPMKRSSYHRALDSPERAAQPAQPPVERILQDNLDAAIQWHMEYQARSEHGPSGASASLLCGRIPQQIADLRARTRKLAAHCEAIHITTSHGSPYAPNADNALTLERLEAAHSIVMGHAKRILQEGDAILPDKWDTSLYEVVSQSISKDVCEL
mmetsp:Transcript_98779/g.156216  ORF Transcript_98779/g.156216 Transcript_98779/m.156216 type:complete len:206 (+) Transcript_98779:72-689(+)|eukprot:CAMPEP_0169064386 /NCGR_PEP_ID=MMETSP1015-20121227/1806_1 /TAXON_ID=342587 /ORGANISM="Karlodinium micrum, Strain CCMP2283" /LENGTH=205 /DNA_ID=CAMNT_0009122817 /DNA_START=23 /DNA_END=640 /DNA_ORIENTATION=-